MKYRLYENASNNPMNVVSDVLKNRGITDANKYLHLNESVTIPFNKLCNIDEAVHCFDCHFQRRNKIRILVDDDVDGNTSASIIYSYIEDLNSDNEPYPLDYVIHSTAKEHGLNKEIVSNAIKDGIKLLIIPDASTNDKLFCNILKRFDVDVIITDHHVSEANNPYAIIVNNQMSEEYTNKEFSGVGITYKFMKALDEFYWTDYADKYLDLVALGNIADMMKLTSLETKYYIDKGLNNINNKLFYALIEAQEYSMNGKVTANTVSWYIAPILNGMIRVGSDEEKDMMFRAFIQKDEYFEYKTRGNKTKGIESEIIQESIYDRVARLCKNAKSRQDKLKEKLFKELQNEIGDKDEIIDKVIIADATYYVENGSLNGLVAMKLAEYYNRPCLLLRRSEDKHKNVVYGGSGRNINNSPILSLKDKMTESNLFNFVRGHNNAFGIQILNDKISTLTGNLNEFLKDIEYDSTYFVDYIFDCNDDNFNMPLINDLSKFDDLVGQGINEPLIAITNINISQDMITICGKSSDTINFEIKGIKFVQFKCTEKDAIFQWINSVWGSGNGINIDIVGKCNMNNFESIITPQIIIKDANINSIFESDEKDSQDNTDDDIGW